MLNTGETRSGFYAANNTRNSPLTYPSFAPFCPAWRGRRGGGRPWTTLIGHVQALAQALVQYLLAHGEPLLDLRLESPGGGMIKPRPLQTLGHALHLHDRVVELVRVLVALAVAEIAHEAGRRVPQMVRNGRGVLLAHGALGGSEAPVDRVALWGLCEIDHRPARWRASPRGGR